MASRRSSVSANVPTVHRFGPYRFFFWSNENRDTREPPHVHVRSANGIAKFWLVPVSLADHSGYTDREVAHIRRVVIGHREELLRQWDEYFAE